MQQAVSNGKLGLVKVGTDPNPADLMTKHLRAEVASQHLETLRYFVSTGRAASAPAFLACSNSDEGDDRWRNRVDAEVIERQHSKPRYALFTTMKVAKGPKSAAAVGKWRITIGELANGQGFFRIGNWKTAAKPHELLPQPWTGTTYFTKSLAVPRLFVPAQLPASQLPITRESA